MVLEHCLTEVMFFYRFDYLHKRQSGGLGQYGRVIGLLQVRVS